ncbi:hypothetical protein [Piscirickettsia salmonis]|uniref:hypothetical protein n=1 Tax=Piscirickettsia salmonis TaxID=1238 RepID=UPI0012BA8C4D|nr:hypothetical protein [Piscirickettsia salmonis]QGP40848.1 hypothetical protein Psal182_03039 [Piscirickettsia salmonis]
MPKFMIRNYDFYKNKEFQSAYINYSGKQSFFENLAFLKDVNDYVNNKLVFSDKISEYNNCKINGVNLTQATEFDIRRYFYTTYFSDNAKYQINISNNAKRHSSSNIINLENQSTSNKHSSLKITNTESNSLSNIKLFVQDNNELGIMNPNVDLIEYLNRSRKEIERIVQSTELTTGDFFKNNCKFPIIKNNISTTIMIDHIRSEISHKNKKCCSDCTIL